MKYFLIAGEASGDMHAASLMKEIKKIDKEAEFRYFGGDLMQAHGGTLLKHYSELAFMGILPVLMNLKTIKKNIKYCENEIRLFKPDVLILVDYPGFNLRIAEFAKAIKIKTAYYISPKIWASRTKRVKKVKAFIDEMYTIFPFETEFYKKHNYYVTYVGNPVWDVIQKELKEETNFETFCNENQLDDKPIIALLAGSRKHEIKGLLPYMEKLKNEFPEHQFVLAGAPGISEEFYYEILTEKIPIIFNKTYKLLRNSVAAVVTSGTATLETALLSVPQVVIYRMGMGWLLELFRKQILKTEFFSLVNLVGEREIVKELFQSEVTIENIKTELNLILEHGDYWIQMLKGYANIQNKINTDGAALKTAHYIVESIKKSNNDV